MCNFIIPNEDPFPTKNSYEVQVRLDLQYSYLQNKKPEETFDEYLKRVRKRDKK